MRLPVVLATLFFFAGPSHAGPCKAPAFEEFVPSKQAPPADTLQVVMQPVARLNIPSGFSKMVSGSHGSMGFGEHPKGIRVQLAFETKETLSFYEKGAQPGPFLMSVFRGLDTVGCRYLESWNLENEDYRLHTTLERGAELFAYGKGEDHHFYLIRTDKPDLALTGLFKRISRAEFESILSSLSIFVTN